MVLYLSGNGNNATTTASVNPIIINAGTIYTINGLPTLYFDGTRYLTTPAF